MNALLTRLLPLLICACSVADAQSPPWWPLHELAPTYRGSDGLAFHDADGDGDLDIAGAWEEGRRISVSTNPGPSEALRPGGWGTRLMWWENNHRVEDVATADLDGDGQWDYVAAVQSPGGVEVLPSSVGGSCTLKDSADRSYLSLAIVDTDGDGDLDILAAGKDGVDRWRTRAGEPRCGRWERREVVGGQNNPWLSVADVDGDGDPDAVYTQRQAATALYWAENPGTDPDPWPRRTICERAGVGALLACEHPDGGWLVPWEDGALTWCRVGTPMVTLPAGPWGNALAKACTFGELNGDAVSELVVVTEGAPDHQVYVRTSNGWQAIDPRDTVIKTDAPHLIDLNGDGRPEIVFSEEHGGPWGWGLGVVAMENPW